jgi:hypothetical protein
LLCVEELNDDDASNAIVGRLLRKANWRPYNGNFKLVTAMKGSGVSNE